MDRATANNTAVFLDRDGVLNELVLRDGMAVSPRRVEDFRLSDGAMQAVQRLREVGLLVFVVSNQPDIARGQLTQEDLSQMSRILEDIVGINEVVVCPHDDADGCVCRKPKPGMLYGLAERWDVDLQKSFVVGDSWKDIEAGRRAGCRTVFLDRGRGRSADADWTVVTLGDAVQVIVSGCGLGG